MSKYMPVAIVSGASSGIGLALTQHLLSLNWAVVALDIKEPAPDAILSNENYLFIKCDVSSWDSQAAAFEQAFQWRRRLDFAALNAGIDDRDDIFRAAAADFAEAPDQPPRKPNMLTFDVNLLGPYYGIKLFTHYYLRNEPATTAQARKSGCIVVTASIGAFYPQPAIPQYCATKAGVVGMVRSLAPTALEVSGIRINTVCPAFVPTPLAPPGVIELWPVEATTPMATIMRAFEELMDEEKACNGQAIEASGESLIYQQPPEMVRPDGSWELQGKMKTAVELFQKSYYDRNLMFARRGAPN